MVIIIFIFFQKWMSNLRYFFFLLGLIFLCLGIWWTVGDHQDFESKKFEEPLGLPPVHWPEKNPFSWAKVELGRKLFFDKRLSSNGTVSCATCHRVPDAYTDASVIAVGIEEHVGNRHTPTIINVAYNDYQFWDGRAKTLEEQVLGPIANTNEMTLEKNQQFAYQDCVNRIHQIEEYRSHFYKVFGREKCTLEDIAMAIATFERTILSGNSPYDRFLAGDKNALTADQINGWKLFRKVGCVNCHLGDNFTNNRFENIGIGMDAKNPDLGRYAITKNDRDWGAFKVPTLRQVSQTAPYMHDGSLKTLEEVIDYYDKGGIPNQNLHSLMQPLHLSDQDKASLVAFLKGLNGEGWEGVSR
jgi:cytochrome c peroxidase